MIRQTTYYTSCCDVCDHRFEQSLATLDTQVHVMRMAGWYVFKTKEKCVCAACFNKFYAMVKLGLMQEEPNDGEETTASATPSAFVVDA
jgi:hypothetical protein